MEFWNDAVTDKSWKVMIELTKRFDMTVIGGWAVYLLTRTLKSRDIDIIVDYETLQKVSHELGIKKNMNLRKYEAVIDEVSVDIYVPYFSKLIIPVEDLKDVTMVVEGIKIVEPEALAVLKQQAEMKRKNSVKGQKDRTDILNILINTEFDFKAYLRLCRRYKLEGYLDRLKEIINNAKREFDYLGIKNLRKIKLIKNDLTAKIKKARTKPRTKHEQKI